MTRIVTLFALLIASAPAWAAPTRLTIRSGEDTLIQLYVNGAVQDTDPERCVLRFEASSSPEYTVLTDTIAVNINNDYREVGEETAVNINNEHRGTDTIAVNINNEHREVGEEIAVNINNEHRGTGGEIAVNINNDYRTVEIAVNINNDYMPCTIER